MTYMVCTTVFIIYVVFMTYITFISFLTCIAFRLVLKNIWFFMGFWKQCNFKQPSFTIANQKSWCSIQKSFYDDSIAKLLAFSILQDRYFPALCKVVTF